MDAAKRCEEICNDVAGETWYKDAVNELIMLREEICDNSNMSLLNEYDNLVLNIQCRTEEKIYTEGFKDGLALAK